MTAAGEARAKNEKWISIGERDRSYGTMRPPADRPIYLLVRSRPDTEPELTVKMDDTEKVGTLVWRHTLLRDPTSSDHSDSPEPRILSLYRFDRDGAVDLAVVKVKTDRGSRELSYASRMPLWKWSSEHALFPTVSADALLVPAGVRLVTDAGVEGSATTPDLLTRANLLDSDFYLIRLGLRTAVGVSGSTTEGDSEPAPQVFASLPLGLDRESTFRVFTAGTGAWATFPIVADDLRRGSDGAERSYNLSLGGRLGIEPTREDDQVPFVEGSLEGRAVLTSMHSKDDLKLVATGKVAVARASTELQNQLELGHHWFTWAFVGGSMGVGEGPSLGIRLVVDPYDDDQPVMPTVVVELGR